MRSITELKSELAECGFEVSGSIGRSGRAFTVRATDSADWSVMAAWLKRELATPVDSGGDVLRLHASVVQWIAALFKAAVTGDATVAHHLSITDPTCAADDAFTMPNKSNGNRGNRAYGHMRKHIGDYCKCGGIVVVVCNFTISSGGATVAPITDAELDDLFAVDTIVETKPAKPKRKATVAK